LNTSTKNTAELKKAVADLKQVSAPALRIPRRLKIGTVLLPFVKVRGNTIFGSTTEENALLGEEISVTFGSVYITLDNIAFRFATIFGKREQSSLRCILTIVKCCYFGLE
jgi:hypothetical protein